MIAKNIDLCHARLILFALVAVFCCADKPTQVLADEDTKKDEPQWTMLFDGKKLEGWSVPKLEGDKKPEIKDGCIVLGRDDLASGIKFDKTFPKSNYEIMYQAKKAKGYDFFGTLTFPVKESHCSFVNGGWGGYVVGISSINGYDASENETTSYYEFEEKQWYQFRVSVTNDRILVWMYPVYPPEDEKELDENEKADLKKQMEKPKIDLLLEDKQLSTRLEVSPYKPLALNTWNTEGHIRDVKFRNLMSAEVEKIKSMPKD